MAAGALRCLITGGVGFIGCNLAERLLRRGHAVTVFDDLSRPGSHANLAWLRSRAVDLLQFVHGDVGDADAVERAVADADVVFHLAAQTAVTTSVAAPRDDFYANALGTLNVLEAARTTPASPIVVYASTNKVYGALDQLAVVERDTRYEFAQRPHGLAEDEPLRLDLPYACSKGVGDQYALAYARLYGLRTVVFRQSCVYGPRQMGVEDQGWVAWFLIAALRGSPITVFGDGKQVRDLLYIDDLLDAYEAAVEKIALAQGRVYNIGGGAAATMSVWAEFAPLLEEVLDLRPEVRFAQWRPGDQRVFYCDTARAKAELAWQPKVAPADGVRRLASWVRSNQSDVFDGTVRA